MTLTYIPACGEVWGGPAFSGCHSPHYSLLSCLACFTNFYYCLVPKVILGLRLLASCLMHESLECIC